MTRCSRRRDEDGSLAPAMPIIATMLLLLGGLGIDSSNALNARGEAVAYAEEAARAGAQQVDLDAVYLGLDRAAAADAAWRYCDAVAKATTEIQVRCTSVDVEDGPDGHPLFVKVAVKGSVKTTLLGLAGITHLDVGGSGKARPYEGIVKPDDQNPTP